MRALITGGAGFVGSNLANFLLKKDWEVTIFDNLSRIGTAKNIDWLKSNHTNSFKIINGDVRNFDQIKELAKNKDAIFHAAAQVAVTTSLQDPRNDFEINSIGTLNVLEAARLSNSDPAVLFTSTNKVYGNNVNLIPLVENKKRYEFADSNFSHGVPEIFSTDANEHTPYGSSKYTADIYMRDYSAVFGLKTVTFRMSCIYGTRQFGNEDQGWVAHFIISSILGKPLTIYGDGKQVRDILFIDDLVQAFNLAFQNIDKIKGEVFNMGGGLKNTISLLEFMELLEQMNGKKLFYTYSDWRPFDQKVYISDIRKAQKFGWEPKISMYEGINRLHKWVIENKHLFA